MILALDTSGGELLACLLDDTLEVVATRVAPGPRHQDVILDVVGELLGDGAAVARLQAIAVVRGPGSQTGLRVGLSTAAGMAYGGRVGLLPLSSLAVAAHRTEVPGEVLAMVSAGRSNVYAQRAGARREMVGARVLCGIAEVTDRLGGAGAPALIGEPALMARAEALGMGVAETTRSAGGALAAAVRDALNAGALLAYHQLTGDYGES